MKLKDLKLTDTLLTADETRGLVCTLESKTCSELAGKLSNNAGYVNIGQMTATGVTAQNVTTLAFYTQCNGNPSNYVAVQYDRFLVSTPETLETYTFSGGENSTDIVRFSDLEGIGGETDPQVPVKIESICSRVVTVETCVRELAGKDRELASSLDSLCSSLDGEIGRASCRERV